MTSAISEEPRPDYLRVRITGTLTCQSDLHVGDGGILPWQERKRHLPEGRKKPDLATDPDYHSVCWIEGKGPYLPASSIRGSLRNGLPEDDPLVQLLFGYVDPKNPDESRAGKLRIYDAFIKGSLVPNPVAPEAWPPPFWNEGHRTSARHGIALDPVTGTVAHGRLFSHELVPAGSVFGCILEADDICDYTIANLLDLLERWDGSLASALGKKKGKGWGRVKWKKRSVKVLDESGLKDWLKADGGELIHFFRDWSGVHDPALLALARSNAPPGVCFTLTPQGPILVCEPGYVREGEQLPDHEYSRRSDNGKAIIPGSSLVGVARGRARRIVATIAHAHATLEQADKCAQNLMDELFGDKTRRGALWIGDAEAEGGVKEHKQYFNAIDRFTGGVKGQHGEGALYQANAKAGGAYSGQIRLEVARLEKQEEKRRNEKNASGKPAIADDDWWKGLLLLVLRDALEGELAVGWGKSKGYGAFRVTLKMGEKKEIDDWAKALPQARDWGDPQQWIKALHDRIEIVCDELPKSADQAESQ